MDEWVRTIVGGIVGGGIAAPLISWQKHREDRRDRLREAYAALIASVEGANVSLIARRRFSLFWASSCVAGDLEIADELHSLDPTALAAGRGHDLLEAPRRGATLRLR
jgi:hypothetical protein